MNRKFCARSSRTLLVLVATLLLTSCVGAVVGAVVDTTIEVAKVPFKIAGAAVDLVIPDKNKDEE